jgi:uncharacterized protein (TIGR03067 family)
MAKRLRTSFGALNLVEVTMRLLTLMVVTMVLTVAAGAFAGDDVTKEKKLLQGTWVVQSVSRAGKATDDGKGAEIEFAGDQVTFKMKKGDEQKEMKGKYKIDPTKKPKTIDIQFTEKKGLGIYELEGDTLRVCHGVKEEESARPTAFTDKEVVVVTLKRKKAAE